MEKKEHFSKVLGLIGEPSRAKILWTLLDGKAYTTTELSNEVGVTLQSASMHLKKLLQNDIVTVEKQGRHKYFRLYNEDVAFALESLLNLGESPKRKTAELTPIKKARTCYDHLAGYTAIQLIQFLLNHDILVEEDEGYSVTKKGEEWFYSHNIDLLKLRKMKRSLSRKCLDWSERKNHLAGSLGAALLDEFIRRKWFRKKKDSRELIVTFEGRKELYDKFKISV